MDTIEEKSSVSIVTGSLIIALALAGCGSNNQANSTEQNKATEKPTDKATDKETDKKVTIEYWQYEFPAKVELINELIKEFQTLHPNITVKQTNFPYDQYNQKVATLVPAGKGPDVINLYYGWLPKYVSSGYLQPLPEDHFPTAEIESNFYPLVSAAKINGSYYAIPTAVRTLALFYNKDLLSKANITELPTTWEQLVDVSKKLTETDAKGQFVTEGFAWEPGAAASLVSRWSAASSRRSRLKR